MLPAYNETYKYYNTPSGNTKILIYRRKEAERRARKKFFRMQRLCGLIMAAIGIIFPIYSGDATISLFAIPLGIGLLLSRKKIMDFRVDI